VVKTESSEEGEMACMNDSLKSEGIIIVKYAKELSTKQKCDT